MNDDVLQNTNSNYIVYPGWCIILNLEDNDYNNNTVNRSGNNNKILVVFNIGDDKVAVIEDHKLVLQLQLVVLAAEQMLLGPQ